MRYSIILVWLLITFPIDTRLNLISLRLISSVKQVDLISSLLKPNGSRDVQIAIVGGLVDYFALRLLVQRLFVLVAHIRRDLTSLTYRLRIALLSFMDTVVRNRVRLTYKLLNIVFMFTYLQFSCIKLVNRTFVYNRVVKIGFLVCFRLSWAYKILHVLYLWFLVLISDPRASM